MVEPPPINPTQVWLWKASVERPADMATVVQLVTGIRSVTLQAPALGL